MEEKATTPAGYFHLGINPPPRGGYFLYIGICSTCSIDVPPIFKTGGTLITLDFTTFIATCSTCSTYFMIYLYFLCFFCIIPIICICDSFFIYFYILNRFLVEQVEHNPLKPVVTRFVTFHLYVEHVEHTCHVYFFGGTFRIIVARFLLLVYNKRKAGDIDG